MSAKNWICVVLGLFAAACSAMAQSPSENWQTLEIPGYRIHTPKESEPWARHVASRLQSISELVQEEVGYTPEDTVDVLVIDPIGRANGSAWPILRKPRMLLYTTPPATDSVLSHFEDWTELLTLHEAVHLTHLLRPSRNARRSMLERLVPVGPLVEKSPKWVIEGYATLLEGRMTGWGRPNGDLRAALLRKWAQMGRLPSYGSLSGNPKRWYGGSFPYLVGSAYLEWLEEREGEDSLRRLWRRLSAKRNRSFEEAFSGVFGDSPSKLYHRFVAEITFRAMSLERQRADFFSEGDLWQDLSRRTGKPAVSPSGDRLAVVIRKRGAPSRLVIWSTEHDPEPLEKWQEARDRLLEQDPEDVAAELSRPLPRKALFKLPTLHGAEPYDPRFTADGESLIFTRFAPASEAAAFPGAQISDLYRWWPESGRVERVTMDAGVRLADPAPDGSWAVAVRHPFGLSELVRVDLETGEVSPLFDREPTIEEVLDHPRLSPDGRHLLYAALRQGRWSVWIRHLATGTERRLPTPERATVSHPDWTPDGKVVLTIGAGGFLDIYEFDPTGGARRQLTRSSGGALAPAATADGALFFLALEEDGFDVRRIWRSGPESKALPADRWPGSKAKLRELAPIVRPEPPKEVPTIELAASELHAEPYGLGPREHFPLVGGGWTRDGGRIELGLRQGDPVGRLELWWLGAASDDGVGTEGFGLAGRWKRLPVEIAARLFATRERPISEHAGVEPVVDHRGLELTLRKSRIASRLSWFAELGLLWDRAEASTVESAELDRGILSFRGSVRGRHRWGAWRLTENFNGSAEVAETEGHGWNRYVFGAAVEVTRQPVDGAASRLRLDYQRGEVHDLRHPLDAFEIGGLRGSLLPFGARARRAVPALPTRTLVGSHFESQRAEFEIKSLPWTFFGERHRAWNGSSHGDWIRLAGLEWSRSSAPMPILRLPGFDVSLGVAQILDPPFEDQVEGWFGFSWRP